MKSLIVALLLVLAGPAFASPQHPTPAQLKDIGGYYDEAFRCRDYIADAGQEDEENQEAKKACDRSYKLGRKLVKQGFCFYKYYHVGRPGKTRGDCDVVRIDH